MLLWLLFLLICNLHARVGLGYHGMFLALAALVQHLAFIRLHQACFALGNWIMPKQAHLDYCFRDKSRIIWFGAQFVGS
ncbi:hypothetical protein HDV63DRAFT_380530 [Trichoderma sp. SZMC 28014]